MLEKWKNILTVGLLSAFLLGFGLWAAVKPADGLSLSERRPLAQLVDQVLAGELPDAKTQVAILKAWKKTGGKL